MNPALLSALSALLGSLIGASASVITSWLSLRGQYQAQQRVTDRTRRETLYSEFIIEASRRFTDAVQAEQFQLDSLAASLALLNRIRLFGDDDTVAAAEEVLGMLMAAYFAEPMSREDLRTATAEQTRDPLLKFSKQARIELLRLR